MRKVQVLVFAKFMSDSAWYFYLFWLPKYLYDVRGFDVKHVSYYAWIPYAASGIGSFLGRMAVQLSAEARAVARLLSEVCSWAQRPVHASCHAGARMYRLAGR